MTYLYDFHGHIIIIITSHGLISLVFHQDCGVQVHGVQYYCVRNVLKNIELVGRKISFFKRARCLAKNLLNIFALVFLSFTSLSIFIKGEIDGVFSL